MARVRPQVAALVLGATLVASIGAGYAWSRINNDSAADSASDSAITESEGLPFAPELVGDPLPAVALEGIDGTTLTSTDLLGQPMVVNVWFSTCAPCAKELPDFAEVDRELGGAVRFVGVNHFDTPETAERFARDKGVEYELYLDPEAALVTTLRIGLFPATLFVASDGTIVELRQGALSADDLRATISSKLLP